MWNTLYPQDDEKKGVMPETRWEAFYEIFTREYVPAIKKELAKKEDVELS
jgi:hypothetical protein